MKKAKMTGVWAISCLILAGCGVTKDTNGNQDGGKMGPKASAEEVQACKGDTVGCGKLKFFDCISAAELASCFDNCDRSTEDEVALFKSCVKNSLCDKQCLSQLRASAVVPAPTPTPTPTPTPGGPSTCEQLCTKFVSDGCVPSGQSPSCAALCADSKVAPVLNYCLPKRMGCTLPAECADQVSPPTPEKACQEACDVMLSLSCIDAAKQGKCRSLCTTKTGAERNTFTACVKSSICTTAGCYTAFADEQIDPVAQCTTQCDEIKRNTCITAAQQTSCRNACSTATAAKRSAFVACFTTPASCFAASPVEQLCCIPPMDGSPGNAALDCVNQLVQ
jgi:hypothetical protein